MLKDMAFCHLQENVVINMVKNLRHHCIKMEFQKIANFLDTTSDDKD